MRAWPLLVVAAVATAASASTIEGNYLEARTADVYTGPCFANGEVNLVGKEATLAWRVERGAWNGVRLDGLSVVGVVRTDATLGDPYETRKETRARIFVDEKATKAQRAALADLARSASEGLLAAAGAPTAVPIAMRVEPASGYADLRAGDVSEIRTRSFCSHDKHCGNEEVYYPPLTEVESPVAAYAIVHVFRGEGLGATWASNEKRSAFLARFER